MAWGQSIVTAVMLFVPLGLYLLGVANALLRDRPTMARATADFAWLLLGISGFLVGVIPASLSRWHDKVRLGALAGESPMLVEKPWFWLAVFCAYFVLVVLLATLEFLARRASTCVYLLEPGHLPDLISKAVEGLKCHAESKPGGAILAWEDPEGNTVQHHLSWNTKVPAGVCVIHWGSTPEALRRSIESRLDTLLAAEHGGSTLPGAIYFLAAGALIMGSLAVSLLQLIGMVGRF